MITRTATMKFKINISADMTAEVTVSQEGDIITATVGRKSAISVPATISPEKLAVRRDKARLDRSAVEVDPCDGYRSATRSVASKVEEAQMVAILRFLGITEDVPDAYAVACALDYAERVAGENALPAPRAEAQKILEAIPVADRDETFALLARARKIYNSAWVNPTWAAEQAALSEAKAAANKARVDALPEDTSWGYAHGGTD